MDKSRKICTKYEEVIVKTILANQIIEKYYFNHGDTTVNWREEVKKIMNEESFDAYKVLAEFIIQSSFANNYHHRHKQTAFIPKTINMEIDNNMEKKFFTAKEEE
jgi:hypothetical protein